MGQVRHHRLLGETAVVGPPHQAGRSYFRAGSRLGRRPEQVVIGATQGPVLLDKVAKEQAGAVRHVVQDLAGREADPIGLRNAGALLLRPVGDFVVAIRPEDVHGRDVTRGPSRSRLGGCGSGHRHEGIRSHGVDHDRHDGQQGQVDDSRCRPRAKPKAAARGQRADDLVAIHVLREQQRRDVHQGAGPERRHRPVLV